MVHVGPWPYGSTFKGGGGQISGSTFEGGEGQIPCPPRTTTKGLM
jgi:hypothetical protein